MLPPLPRDGTGHQMPCVVGLRNAIAAVAAAVIGAVLVVVILL